MNYLKQHGEVFLLIIAIITAVLLGTSQLFADQSLPQKILLGVGLIFWIVAFAYCLFKSDFPFFRKNAARIGLTLLIIYVIILGLATISEIFELGWFDWL
jgi:uncharacterized membrane protein